MIGIFHFNRLSCYFTNSKD